MKHVLFEWSRYERESVKESILGFKRVNERLERVTFSMLSGEKEN